MREKGDEFIVLKCRDESRRRRRCDVQRGRREKSSKEFKERKNVWRTKTWVESFGGQARAFGMRENKGEVG